MTKINIEHSRNKIDVAILGATGMVGQAFIHLLSNHPLFNIAMICGTDSREGKVYNDEVQWVLPIPKPDLISNLNIETLKIENLRGKKIQIVFSALPADIAKSIEPKLREKNFFVFSNASALRYDEDVPILIPEVNRESLELIRHQGYPEKGFVVTNANCSTTGLAVALAPLRKFGIKEIFVSTYQSFSGAGYPGHSGLDILGNIIPYIPKEEEKMKIEIQKILQISAKVYPHCIRVPVPYGHLETVWLTFKDMVNRNEILTAWQDFRFEFNGGEYSALAHQPLVYLSEQDLPQPKMSFWGSPPGMQVFLGRLRQEDQKIGFSLLSNNLVRGAAGGSIANAELFVNSFIGASPSQLKDLRGENEN